MQRNKPEFETCLTSLMLLADPSRDGAHFRLLLRLCDARLEPADHAEVATPAHLGIDVESRRYPEVSAGIGDRDRSKGDLKPRRKIKVGRHNPDHRVVLIVECDALSDDLSVGAETPAPEAVAQNHDTISAWTIFFGQKSASQ